MENTQEWFSAEQAAAVKGVTSSAVRLAIKEKRLFAEKLGRSHMIHRTALAAWQPAGKRGADSADP